MFITFSLHFLYMFFTCSSQFYIFFSFFIFSLHFLYMLLTMSLHVFLHYLYTFLTFYIFLIFAEICKIQKFILLSTKNGASEKFGGIGHSKSPCCKEKTRQAKISGVPRGPRKACYPGKRGALKNSRVPEILGNHVIREKRTYENFGRRFVNSARHP